MHPRSFRLVLLTGTLLVLGLAAGSPASAERIDPPAVITNGTIALGVNPAAQLIIPPASATTGQTGVTFLPTGNDGLRQVIQSEGWGAASAAPSVFQGRVTNFHGAANVVVEKFVTTQKHAESRTIVAPGLEVTHFYRPSPKTEFLYEADVVLRNIGTTDIADLRYSRVMDWDIEPTPFAEFVTVQQLVPARPLPLRYSDDNGFTDPAPLAARIPLVPSTANVDFTDVGPFDHGAILDFRFVDGQLGPDNVLRPGQSKKITIYYGAAPTEAAALAALGAVGAEVYSFGQPNGGQTTGAPNTFIFGFEDDEGREGDSGPPDSAQEQG